MGMSASQMRYAMLTGRKSDVQFQGQQINQQRTTLATETSAYNAQLLDLTVPTPPSTSDYTTTNYSYINSDGQKYTITGTTYDASTNTYTINASYNTTGNKVMSGLASYYKSTTNGVDSYYTGSNDKRTNLTKVDLANEDSTIAAQDVNNLQKIYGSNYANNTYYKYTVDGTTRYIDSNTLETAATTKEQASYKYVKEDADVTIPTTLTGAKIQWSSSGRMESITTSTGTSYSLSVASTTDDNAYKDAYEEYEFQKGEYSKKVNDINAQIDIVESEDKKLELKLKDLDTQNNALNTEMDSVKKVIDKNIEQSFKAFA